MVFLNPSVPVERLASVDSTNDYLLRKASEGCQGPLACVAETQTRGKGRKGRNWFAPPHANIYLSLLWPFPREAQHLSSLSLAIALCVVHTLEQIGIHKPLGIKWPNDVLSLGRKLCGILIESLPSHKGTTRAVIGIGLNVYPFEAPDQAITQPWTTVQALSETSVDRTALLERLLENLAETARAFGQQGFEAFYDRWPSYDLSLHKNLRLIGPTGTLEGIGRGIDTEGCLILENSAGVLVHHPNGELSLRVETASMPKGAAIAGIPLSNFN